MKYLSCIRVWMMVLLASRSLGAVNVYGNESVDLYGFLDPKTTLIIGRTAAASSFDLTDSSVAPKDQIVGLQIGAWTLMTNALVNVKVTTKPMVKSSDSQSAISYQIGIQYPTHAESPSSTKIAYINNTGSDADWNLGSGGVYTLGSTDRIMTYTDNPIYFRLYQKDASSYGSGYYTGSILFTLTNGE